MFSTILNWSLARFWNSLGLFVYVLISKDVLGGFFSSLFVNVPGFL